MFQHTTVLLREAVEGLNIKPDGIYVDCTLGGAGHTEEILKRLSEKGKVYAFDQDLTAVENAKKKLAIYGNRLEIIHRNFAHLKEELHIRNVFQVDGILYDLGVSSPQLDEPDRGFSYHHDALLDMRMDQHSPISAKEVVNEWPYEKLVKIFLNMEKRSFPSKLPEILNVSVKNRRLKQRDNLWKLSRNRYLFRQEGRVDIRPNGFFKRFGLP